MPTTKKYSYNTPKDMNQADFVLWGQESPEKQFHAGFYIIKHETWYQQCWPSKELPNYERSQQVASGKKCIACLRSLQACGHPIDMDLSRPTRGKKK